MSTTQYHIPPGVSRLGKRAGYTIAVVVNLAMLVVVLNILEWDVLAWLTDDFATVIPWISLSLVASIVVNVVYEFNDTPVVKATGQIGIDLISLVVASRILVVFPFDFSAYSFDWAIVTRLILVLALVGAGIGVITETVKLASRDVGKRGR